MNECIKVTNITKKYGNKTAVSNLSFSVKTGEIFGLLGHNGAGKSTVLDCMLGLTQAEGGTAEILGMCASRNRKILFRRVGVQLQHSSYQNNIRLGEICEEMSALYDAPEDYKELLKQFQMSSFINQPVDKLSGGEKQKLSIVIALLPNPEVIFLDELTTGLDAAARREVWMILEGLKQKGMTIFLTTHYMEEAKRLCDHILILKNGKKVTEGTVKEVIGQSPYANLEEAYLWHMGEEKLV